MHHLRVLAGDLKDDGVAAFTCATESDVHEELEAVGRKRTDALELAI
jgi:hypothetical protein